MNGRKIYFIDQSIYTKTDEYEKSAVFYETAEVYDFFDIGNRKGQHLSCPSSLRNGSSSVRRACAGDAKMSFLGKLNVDLSVKNVIFGKQRGF